MMAAAVMAPMMAAADRADAPRAMAAMLIPTMVVAAVMVAAMVIPTVEMAVVLIMAAVVAAAAVVMAMMAMMAAPTSPAVPAAATGAGRPTCFRLAAEAWQQVHPSHGRSRRPHDSQKTSSIGASEFHCTSSVVKVRELSVTTKYSPAGAVWVIQRGGTSRGKHDKPGRAAAIGMPLKAGCGLRLRVFPAPAGSDYPFTL